MGYLTNTGTVVISVGPSSDASTIESQRQKLRMAISARDLEGLLAALDGNRGMDSPELREETEEAISLVNELRAQDGVKEPYVEAKGNTSSKLNVLSVVQPYSVLDDLSYKISKTSGHFKDSKSEDEPGE